MSDAQKIAFIVVFFGKIPAYFPFWACSCRANCENIHWYVYTDTASSVYELNEAVTVLPFTFKELTDSFKKNINIDIAANSIRKICDYRPLYYFLVNNRSELEKFSFIGYTDIDMIYGRINEFLPDNINKYSIITANNGWPCGPFTLLNREDIKKFLEDYTVINAMKNPEHLAFDESVEVLNIISQDKVGFCSAEYLQPQRSKYFNHRKNFCIWNQNGSVTVFDNRFHKKEGAFYHFSRYKNRSRFKVNPVELNTENFAVYKYGIIPVRSKATTLLMRLSLLY